MAASESSSVVRPHPSGAPEASEGPPMAHAPKPIALTLIPVFPSSRYCIALDSKSLLRLKCDVDDVRVVVVHGTCDAIDDQSGPAGDTEDEPSGSGRVAAREAYRIYVDRQSERGSQIHPVRGGEAALELNVLRRPPAHLDVDVAAIGFARNRQARRRRAAGGDVAGASDRGGGSGRI